MLRYFRFHLLSSKRKLEIYAQSQYQLLTCPFVLLAGHNEAIKCIYFYAILLNSNPT